MIAFLLRVADSRKPIVSAVATYVSWQLSRSARTYDRMFAQYQSPESEASRQKVFGDQGRGDPRRSVFNVLGWRK